MTYIKNMIEFMMHNAEGLLVYQTDQILHLKMSSLRFIKLRCEQALFSYEGYVKTCKKQLEMSYKIPVVIDDETMLIPSGGTRVYETIWINYPSIIEMKTVDSGIQLIFISGRELMLNTQPTVWLRQIHDLMKIRNTKVKHFHGQSYRKCLQ